MHHLIADLYPICRSITGEGVRKTLHIIGGLIPLEVHEVPTGTQVLDWTIPKEWRIRDAHVKNGKGERVVDFRQSNLHVMSYSVPVHARMSLAKLKSHVYTLPDRPEWIPYRTSYYAETWAFCMSHRALGELPEGEYEVVIDSTLHDGYLTYGESYLRGTSDSEVLISCHICHPSLCNDNLSGIALTTYLARELATRSLRYSYRFLFIPGTIGAITWLALNQPTVSRVRHGLVVACVGDAGKMTYKRSRQGSADIDRAVVQVLKESGDPYEVVDFTPYGYDERQYCSPGFDLPVGSLSRTPYSRYPEYHTSADDLAFVHPECLADSLQKYLSVVDVLENDRRYRNTNPKGEPQLGKRGIYPTVGGGDAATEQLAMLWVLNLSDGRHSLLDVAERSGLPFARVRAAAESLARHSLLVEEVG
jgi:aminopeptidase-like protein